MHRLGASDQKVLRLARGARLDGEDLWGFGAQVAFEDSSIDASFERGRRPTSNQNRVAGTWRFHTSVDEKNGYEYEFGEEDCMELLSFFEWKHSVGSLLLFARVLATTPRKDLARGRVLDGARIMPKCHYEILHVERDVNDDGLP